MIMGIKIVLTEDQADRLQAKVGKLPINEANLACRYLDFDSLESELGSRDKKKIGYETIIRRIDDFTMAVKYHNTDIITIDVSNIVKLNNGGWDSRTTKDRMNQFLRCRDIYINQKNYEWFITSKETGTIPYVNGMQIHPDGHISKPTENKTWKGDIINKAKGLDIDPRHRELYGLSDEEE